MANPNQFNSWEFVSTPKGNDRFEFSFYKPSQRNQQDKELTWTDFIPLCKGKDSDFNTIFRQALNDATDKLGAYFWECLPVSKDTLNRPFRFVVTKNEELKNMKQDFSSFIEPEKFGKFKITTGEPKVISFPTNSSAKDGILVVPSPYENQQVVCHNKNISEFTKHAPVDKQLELWKEAATQLSQELAKNDGPRWLSTHGLGSGTRYLHVRIYNNPKYYSYNEYKKFDKNAPVPEIPRPQNPTPTPASLREKILNNLDKISLDPIGYLTNAELLKKWSFQWYFDHNNTVEEHRKKGLYKVKIDNREEIDCEEIFKQPNWGKEDYQIITQAIVAKIKSNPTDWEIIKENKWKVARNKKTGLKHYQPFFLTTPSFLVEEKKRTWDQIEAALKNKNSPQTPQPSQQKKSKWYEPTNYPGTWITAILTTLLLVIFALLLVRKAKKKKKKKKTVI